MFSLLWEQTSHPCRSGETFVPCHLSRRPGYSDPRCALADPPASLSSRPRWLRGTCEGKPATDSPLPPAADAGLVFAYLGPDSPRPLTARSLPCPSMSEGQALSARRGRHFPQGSPAPSPEAPRGSARGRRGDWRPPPLQGGGGAGGRPAPPWRLRVSCRWRRRWGGELWWRGWAGEGGLALRACLRRGPAGEAAPGRAGPRQRPA